MFDDDDDVDTSWKLDRTDELFEELLSIDWSLVVGHVCLEPEAESPPLLGVFTTADID